ncbi:MAG TPA: VWA domain-containing protein [Acidobacteriota bacterium]|nr:VWA domain-containing protein [Acidobacteriota bacterium]
MPRNSFFVLTFVLVVLLAPPVFCQLEEEVRVDLIEVWAKVTDKDNKVVTDLKPEEFSIFIDGKQMDMRCFDKVFDEVPVVEEEDTFQVPPTDDPRRVKRSFVFFFDLLHTSSRDLDFLKNKISTFLETSFHEQQDQGMVFVLLPSMHLGVVQKMTSTRDALIDVISKMRGNPTQEVRVRNNEKELLEVLYAFAQGGQTPTGGERGGVASRSVETIRQARGLARTFASQEKNLSKITLNSFLSISDYLADNASPGRVVMIYVSGGFSIRPGQNYYDIVDKAIDDTSVVGSEDMVFRDKPDNDFEIEVRNAIGLLNRLNVTIYSIDANGLLENNRGADRDTRMVQLGTNAVTYTQELQDSLAMISRETGGMAFLNSQNFERGLREVADDMNQQYWLCSSLPPFKKRGTYHKIEVKVARADLNVRHRRGYVE